MTRSQEAEPPSLFQPPVFTIGRDRRGNWVVQAREGTAGGLFVTREAALRYVRSENGYQPRVVVMVSGDFELKMDCGTEARDAQFRGAGPLPQRRIA